MDERLLVTFREESLERVERMSTVLLAAEAGNGAADAIGELFRDAHSIKGAAAMVGFGDVSRVAHRLEDILDQLRSGKRAAEPGQPAFGFLPEQRDELVGH